MTVATAQSDSNRPQLRFANLAVRLVILVLLLLAFFLRLHLLDFQELRGDEAFGYFFSLRPFGNIIDATIALQEPHPVASYFVQKVWLTWAGQSEFALRFGGVWWGVLAVALLYRLAGRLGFRAWPATLAALLLVISPYAIWHSQDARMYAMSLALTIAAVIFAGEALQRQRWPWVVAYIGTAWLALQTHYYAVFVLLALNLFVLGRALFLPRTRALVVPWLLWQAIVAMLFLPWFLRAATILSDYGGNGDSPPFGDALARSLGVFAVGESTPTDQRLWWALAAALLAFVGVVRLAMGDGKDRRNLTLLLLYLGVPLLATWYGAQSRPIFNERYLVTALPPLFMLMAAAFEGRRLNRPVSVVVSVTASLLLVVAVTGMVLSLNAHYNDLAYSKTRGWRSLASTVDRLARGEPPERVRIAQNYPDPTLWYYYRGPVDHLVLPPSAHDGPGASSTVETLAALDVRRVILPMQPAENWDSENIAANALAVRYDRVVEVQAGVWPIEVFGQPGGAFSTLDAEFANGVRLQGVVVTPQSAPPGGLVSVHLDWRGEAENLSGSEKVFVHLLDGTGALVAQDDRPLVLTGARVSGTGLAGYGLLLPETLTPGVYRLVAGIYDPDQAGAPRILTTGGTDVVPLAELTVTGG